MLAETTLHIRLTRGTLPPRAGVRAFNEFRGGPETLLGWLETQLGLARPHTRKASRVTEFANALDAVQGASFSKSLLTDRWATASELLSRRDDLLLAGWAESDDERLPPLVRDLSRAAQGRTFIFPGEGGRLRQVLSALEQGQALPDHRCILLDRAELWPPLWRAVLDKLTIAVEPEEAAAGAGAAEGTALCAAQAVVAGRESSALVPQDTTLRYVTTRSETAACEFMVASLASSAEFLPDTVIYCEDDNLALRLDACLQRMGLPTMGASATSRAHPALQVLPLALALCWGPVDPQVLLGFLNLPIKPLAWRVASRLAVSLTEEPGLGSRAWEKAVAELCDPKNDPDGKTRQRLDTWLLCERVPRGEVVPAELIGKRCGLVAQWAAGRALQSESDPLVPPDLVRALQIAAAQAALLGELAQSQGGTLSEPQLKRLLDEALSLGIESTPCIEADGGPVRVRSLAEITTPCKRLIWLGLGTADAAVCRWTKSQLSALAAAGLDLDDGSRRLEALRSAEARGFSCVKETLLAVRVPRDLEQREHPLWLSIGAVLQDSESPPALEDLVATNETNDIDALAPFLFRINEKTTRQPQKARPVWKVPSGSLRDRTRVSATELQDRLACPLKWVFSHQAKLYKSRIAALPGTHQLKGIFCHGVLERVFGSGGPLPSVDEARARTEQIFDERLPLDAAPLAQAERLDERQRLLDELQNATRVLVETLSAGKYCIVGMEVEISKDAFGKKMGGRIDCVAARDDGTEAVIDFKYAGSGKYRDLISDGRAVQLASYAYSRSSDGQGFPAVAYLVLADAQMLTPSGSPINGGSNLSPVKGLAIQTVWDQFSAAIVAADGWLKGDEPIPVRPLQGISEWPQGASLVLKEKLKRDESQPVCRYCDYKKLCGLEASI